MRANAILGVLAFLSAASSFSRDGITTEQNLRVEKDCLGQKTADPKRQRRWLSDAAMLDMMLSPRHAPPENVPLTPDQIRSGRALWARMTQGERRVLLKAMWAGYTRGPANLSRITDSSLHHALALYLQPKDRQVMRRFLAHLSGSEIWIVKRMYLNCLVKLA